MNVLGIIAEYNPFHNGHLYHLQESKRLSEADYTVCAMSGDFTQRGEQALADKWTRAKMAVENGADLVLELPFVFACNNAEYFAMGGVTLLDSLGCITHLSFGSESGDIKLLSETSRYLTSESSIFKQYLKENLKMGSSYPKARYEAMKKYAGDQASELLLDPNNILAIEYLKQLALLESKIKPITVKRFGTGYHDQHTFEDIASATAIRMRLKGKNSLKEIDDFVPKKTFEILNDLQLEKEHVEADFYQLILYRILTGKPEELRNILSISEGLENRVAKAVSNSKDLDTLIKNIKSKRYTETRIQRVLVHILLHLDKTSFFSIIEEKILYGRILAFNRKGAELIKHIKGNELSKIPLITNINREVPKDSILYKMLSYDISAADIYNLIHFKEIISHSDFIMKPYKDFA